MQFSDDILIRIIIFVLAVGGFLVARYIHQHKRADQTPLVCPVGFDCDAVVQSGYSKFLGMPVEFMGMIYYALISLAYLIFIFWGEIMPGMVIGFLLVSSLGAFLFSLYLIIIQIFIIKKGCSWCIISSIISACIFILTIFAYDFVSIAKIFVK